MKKIISILIGVAAFCLAAVYFVVRFRMPESEPDEVIQVDNATEEKPVETVNSNPGE